MGKRGQNEGTLYRRKDGRWEGNAQSTRVLVKKTVREWRLERSRQVKRFAAAVGISNQTIVQFEHGQRALSLYMMTWLSKVLPVTPRDIAEVAAVMGQRALPAGETHVEERM
jgi:transcriptional regulator with XRE-family HTH domain